MIKYETLMVVRPDLTDEEIGDLHGKVSKRLADKGGIEIAFQNWGKRKLAYELKDNMKGVYLYYRYLGLGTVVADIERQLSILDPVLRFITVRLDGPIDAQAFDVEADRAGINPFGARKSTRSDERRDGFGEEVREGAPAEEAVAVPEVAVAEVAKDGEEA
jgi:small subunit ribosomal protein S6